MVKTSHNETFKINSAGNYTINADNKTIVINTIGAVNIILPHLLKDNDRVNIISIVDAPLVSVKDSALVELATLTNNYGVLQLEYNTTAGLYVFRALVASPSVSDGWSLDGTISVLGDSLGIKVENIDIVGTENTPYAVISVAGPDAIIDITPLDTSTNLIKNFSTKWQFTNTVSNLRIQSTLGFSDGSIELLCSSCCLINNGESWVILSYEPALLQFTFNDTLVLGMGVTPLELLPEPAFSQYYNIKEFRLEFQAGATAYINPTATQLQLKAGSVTIGVIDITFIEGVENKFLFFKDFPQTFLMSALKALTITTDDASDPTLGDGTLTAWVKYEQKTFNL